MNNKSFDYARLHRQQLEIGYNQRDIDTILNAYVEQPTFVDHALGQTLTSREEIRQYVLAQWELSTADEAKLEELIDAGDTTVARFVISGVNDRSFGELGTSNRPFEVNICNVVRWGNGKILEDHLYYDFYGLLAQLGHAEPLAATTS